MFFGGALYGSESAWLLFAGFHVAVLLRILADMLSAQWSHWLYLAVVAAWLICFLPWVMTYLPIYLRPRADGNPS